MEKGGGRKGRGREAQLKTSTTFMDHAFCVFFFWCVPYRGERERSTMHRRKMQEKKRKGEHKTQNPFFEVGGELVPNPGQKLGRMTQQHLTEDEEEEA